MYPCMHNAMKTVSRREVDWLANRKKNEIYSWCIDENESKSGFGIRT